jgi:hypothetical protein
MWQNWLNGLRESRTRKQRDILVTANVQRVRLLSIPTPIALAHPNPPLADLAGSAAP